MSESDFHPKHLDEIFADSEREYIVLSIPTLEDCVEVMRVRESAGRIEMDKRPLTADYIKAVITADNQIIPVVAKQDMTAAATSSTSREVIHKS